MKHILRLLVTAAVVLVPAVGFPQIIQPGGGGGGGMLPDTEKVPGKRPLKMKKGGSVKSSASKRADGIAKKGKTRGKMV